MQLVRHKQRRFDAAKIKGPYDFASLAALNCYSENFHISAKNSVTLQHNKGDVVNQGSTWRAIRGQRSLCVALDVSPFSTSTVGLTKSETHVGHAKQAWPQLGLL
jgi:hypothetical protein